MTNVFVILVSILLFNGMSSFSFFYNNYHTHHKITRNICMKSLQKHNVYKSKTSTQEKYIEYLKNNNIKIVCSVGPAGTGKTFLACSEAIQLLKHNSINKIILTRPVVPVEEDIGFLPGNLVKKMDPWTKPILDVFEESFSRQEIDNFIRNNIIEICPLAYMRGRTFKNAFIIADEMQNSSPNQMLMLTTRIGENSKMVITGDLKQTDKPCKSGLLNFITKFYNYKTKYFTRSENKTNAQFIKDVGIQVVQFNNSDIQRSKVVATILDIYEDVAPLDFYNIAQYNYTSSYDIIRVPNRII